MKPSSRCALVAAVCLAGLVLSFAGGSALAGGPWFAHRFAVGQGRAVMFRPAQRPSRLVHHGFNRASARIARRFLASYGGYAPYYVSALPEEQPAGAPVIVETTTPVNVNVGMPADLSAGPPLCSGPQIIELVEPKETPVGLPRVIYGTPLPCAAQRAARSGPGVYYLD